MSRGALVALLVASLPSVPCFAQRVSVIPDEASCAKCRIGLELVVTLQTGTGDGTLIGDPLDVERDHAGRSYVVDYRDRTRVLVFGSDGLFSHAVGRPGEGPGEFKRIDEIEILPDDSLVVLEFSRVSVFDASGRFVRSTPLRGRKDDAFVDGRVVVFSGSVSTPDQIGLPFHTHSLDDDAPASSFGMDETFRPGQMSSGFSVAPAEGRGMWAGSRYQYVIDRWTRGPMGTRLVDVWRVRLTR